MSTRVRNTRTRVSRCACSTHLRHDEMCDDECDCFVRSRSSVEYGSEDGRKAADITTVTRVWVGSPETPQ